MLQQGNVRQLKNQCGAALIAQCLENMRQSLLRREYLPKAGDGTCRQRTPGKRPKGKEKAASHAVNAGGLPL